MKDGVKLMLLLQSQKPNTMKDHYNTSDIMGITGVGYLCALKYIKKLKPVQFDGIYYVERHKFHRFWDKYKNRFNATAERNAKLKAYKKSKFVNPRDKNKQ